MDTTQQLLINTPITLALAIVALWLGYRINQWIPVLHQYNIPPAVTGGLPISAMVAVAEVISGWDLRFDLQLRDLLLIIFSAPSGSPPGFDRCSREVVCWRSCWVWR